MLYETDEQRATEERISKFLEDRWRCLLPKQPGDNLVIDRFCYSRDGVLRGIVEIKGRDGWSGTFRDWILETIKLVGGEAQARALRVPFIYVNEWDDGVFWIAVCDGFGNRLVPMREGTVSRNDRGKSEMGFYISSDYFRKVD